MTPSKNLVHFKGKIEQISDGARVDADSYMIVNGKKILYCSGAQYQKIPFGPLDPAIDISNEDIEGKKYIGKTVEVHAVKNPDDKNLSLQAEGAYIKLLDKTLKDTKVQGVVEWAGVDDMGAASITWPGLGHILLTNGTKIIYKDPSIFAAEPRGTIKTVPNKGDKIEALVTKVEGNSYWRDNSPAYTLYGKKSYYIKVK